MARPDFNSNGSGRKVDQRTIEDEIDRIQGSIQSLDIKILRERQDLERLRVNKRRCIEKCNSQISLMLTQIAILEKQMIPQPQEERSSPESNTIKKEEEEEDEGAIDDGEDNERLFVDPNWNVQNNRKLVLWQVERHHQWAGKTPAWSNKKDFYEKLDIRTADELDAGQPLGHGNMSLNPVYCHLDPGSYKWGQPAAALLHHARTAYKNPEGWILLDKPRELLIAMENWFFALSKEERENLPENANDWQDMAEETIRKWNEALQTGELNAPCPAYRSSDAFWDPTIWNPTGEDWDRVLADLSLDPTLFE